MFAFFPVSPPRGLCLCALPESLSVASLTTRCARRAFVPSGCNPANYPERVPQTYWRGIADGPDSAAAHVEHWLALPRVVGHRPIDSGVVCQGASGTFTVPIVRAIQRRITARAAGISIFCGTLDGSFGTGELVVLGNGAVRVSVWLFGLVVMFRAGTETQKKTGGNQRNRKPYAPGGNLVFLVGLAGLRHGAANGHHQQDVSGCCCSSFSMGAAIGTVRGDIHHQL